MISLVLGDLILESLTPSVNALLVLLLTPLKFYSKFVTQINEKKRKKKGV
jgi:hypothetical protein